MVTGTVGEQSIGLRLGVVRTVAVTVPAVHIGIDRSYE